MENDDTYQCLDEDAYDMVALYTNSTELMERKNQNKEGDGVNMCQAIKEMLQDERTERTRQDIMRIMKNLQMTAEQAMDVLEIPEEERSKYL